MHGSIQRRLSVAMNWSVARMANLDARERYEDSFALTQEFREWILCLDDQPELLAESVLWFRRSCQGGHWAIVLQERVCAIGPVGSKTDTVKSKAFFRIYPSRPASFWSPGHFLGPMPAEAGPTSQGRGPRLKPK